MTGRGSALVIIGVGSVVCQLLVSALVGRLFGSFRHDSFDYLHLAVHVAEGRGYTYDPKHLTALNAASEIAWIRKNRPPNLFSWHNDRRALRLVSADESPGELRPTRMRQPLYPIFLALVFRAVGYRPLGVFVAQALLVAATCVLGSVCAGSIWPKQKSVRLVAAGLLALFPPLAATSSVVLADGLFVFLVIASFCLVVRLCRDPSNCYLAGAAGGLMGLAVLTKPLGLVSGAILIAIVLCSRSCRARAPADGGDASGPPTPGPLPENAPSNEGGSPDCPPERRREESQSSNDKPPLSSGPGDARVEELRGSRHARDRRVLPGAFLVVCFAVPPLVWATRNAARLGHFTPLSGEGGYNMWAATYDPVSPLAIHHGLDLEPLRDARNEVPGGHYWITGEADAFFRRQALRRIKESPTRSVLQGVSRVIRVGLLDFPGGRSLIGRRSPLTYRALQVVTLGLWSLFLVGILSAGRQGVLLWVAPLTIAVTCLATFAPSRALLAYQVLLLIGAAAGAVTVVGRRRLRRRGTAEETA